MSSFDYKIGKRSYKYDLSQLSDEEKKKFIGLTRPQKMKYIKEHGGHQKNEVKAGQAIPTEPPIGFAPTKPLYTLPSVSIDDNKTIDDSNDSDKQHDLIDLMYIRNNADKIINGDDTKYQKEDITAFLDKGKTKFDDDKWTKAYNARYNALPKKKQQLVKDKDFVDAVKNASPIELDEIKGFFDEVKDKIGEVKTDVNVVKDNIGKRNYNRAIVDLLKGSPYAIPMNVKIGELAQILTKDAKHKNVAPLWKFITAPSTIENRNDMTLDRYVKEVLSRADVDPKETSYANRLQELFRMIEEDKAPMKTEGTIEEIRKEENDIHAEEMEDDPNRDRNLLAIDAAARAGYKIPSPKEWKKGNTPWKRLIDKYDEALRKAAKIGPNSEESKELQALYDQHKSEPFNLAEQEYRFVLEVVYNRIMNQRGKGFPKKQLQGKSRALQLISKTGSKMPSKKQLHKCLNKKEIKELYGLMQGGSVSKTVQSSPHWSIKIKGGAMELTQYNNNTLSLSSPSELSEYNTSATALANSASTNAVIPAGATWKSVSDDMMALASLATGTKPAEVVEQLNKMNRVRAEIAHRDYVNKFVPANLRSKTIQRIPLKAAMIATDAIKKKQITDKVINDIRGYPGLSKQQSDALRSLLKMKGNRVKQFKKILGIN